jgi:homoserine kinase
MPAIIEAALAAGAYGACLSGGGSSLIALAGANFHPILQSMQETARSLGIDGRGMILSADQQGARVIAPHKRSRKKSSYRHVPSTLV